MSIILTIVYILLIIILCLATFIDKAYGHDYALANIYHTWWFFCVWALLGLSGTIVFIKRFCLRKAKSAGLYINICTIHLSLAIILIGAATSFLTSHEGTIRLYKDIPQQIYHDGAQNRIMPYAITFDNALEADGEIKTSFTVRDYHFHLSSISADHQSAIYTLRHDPWGTGVTYLGYLMLLICSIVHFANSLFYKTTKTTSSLCRSSNPSIRNQSFLLPTIIIIPIAYCTHWFYYGRMPLSNGYEVMLLLSLCILATGIIAFKNDRSMLRTSIITSLAIFAAALIFMDSNAGPIPPILNSPLLYLHVITIIIAYALLTTITIISAKHLLKHHQSLPHPHLLTTGVLLLATGIFLGAVWANTSWGRYWSWDPKEVWALITLLVYSVPLHHKSIKFLQNPKYYHLYMLLAFLTVLMTYFGVNYFLGGMHSYA